MPRSARVNARSVRSAAAAVPLGSLTQPGARAGQSCRACGGSRVTRITMALTDGTPVQFTSCHSCDHRSWEQEGHGGDFSRVLDFAQVLDKTRKTA
jgi:hypothetical protein